MGSTKKTNKDRCKLSTDVVARSIFNNLLSDFRAVHTNFGRSLKTATDDIDSIRSQVFPDYSGSTVPRFRAYYQLQNLFKKYRFTNDTMTDDQLKEATYQKYNAFQVTRATYTQVRCRLPRSPRVLQTARRICRNILGEFDLDEILRECRFGRNSSVGCNFANAYLDHKFSEPEAFTSTVGAHTYFESILVKDALLNRAFGQRLACVHDVLPLIQVPKKFNVNRTITPLTLIALWFSYGLGVVVEERLANHNLNIGSLQEIHRRLVKRYSVTGSHATLDLSFGSENITSWLLKAIVPYKWCKAIMATTTRTVTQDRRPYYVESVLPMGNGCTFPVETLIFYCLIRAIGELCSVTGRYSAYGDDLIAPSEVTPVIYEVFKDLGIVINTDKSFYQGSFRESCGADYYNGAPVRPFFMPEGIKYPYRTSKKYASYLYKCFNGLCARWSPEEIPNTLRSIFMELVISTNGHVLVVPPSYPDGSGIKVHDLRQLPVPSPYWEMPKSFFANGSRSYRFSFLCEVPKKRVALNTLCYYWETLQGSLDVKVEAPMQIQGLVDGVPYKYSWHLRDRWTSLVLKDYLHHLKYCSPSSVTYTSRLKTAVYRDHDGNKKEKKRLIWTAWTADKQLSSFAIQMAGCESHVPSHEGMDPIITDWI